MSDTAPIASSMAAAAQSLRDTAKWLVGGVAATAAGVFAGSSLTAFGALDPLTDTLRFSLASGGVVAGFLALAFILYSAVQVLTRESMTFREIATSEEGEIRKLRERLLQRYRNRLPAGKTSLAEYVAYVDEAHKRGDREIPAAAAVVFGLIAADGGFLLAKQRFNVLLCVLGCATPVAIIGFGLFAWAANPPKPKSAPPAFSLTIQGTSQR